MRTQAFEAGDFYRAAPDQDGADGRPLGYATKKFQTLLITPNEGPLKARDSQQSVMDLVQKLAEVKDLGVGFVGGTAFDHDLPELPKFGKKLHQFGPLAMAVEPVKINVLELF